MVFKHHLVLLQNVFLNEALSGTSGDRQGSTGGRDESVARYDVDRVRGPGGGWRTNSGTPQILSQIETGGSRKAGGGKVLTAPSYVLYNGGRATSAGGHENHPRVRRRGRRWRVAGRVFSPFVDGAPTGVHEEIGNC